MAGILSADKIIEQKAIEDALHSIAKSAQPIIKAFDDIAIKGNAIAQSVGGIQNLSTLINLSNQATKNTSSLTIAQKELLKIQNQIAAMQARQTQAYHNLNRQRQEALYYQQQENREIRQSLDSLNGQRSSFQRLTSAIRNYVAAYISVQAVMGISKSVFNQTKELDQLSFSMRTVIKDTNELAATQKFLSETAINYGGDLLTISERYIKFRAAAMQSNMTMADTQKIFDSVSKASGVLGLRVDETAGVYLALEQMISKGKVTTEELRRQLGERLPGAFGIMANALGVTVSELDKMLKKGEIISSVALPKFADALQKAYGIESLKSVDTLAAAQGRLTTSWTKFIEGLKLSGTFKSVINTLGSMLHFVSENATAIKFLSKSALLAVEAWAIYRTSVALNNWVEKQAITIQTTRTLTTGRQILVTRAATVAETLNAVATTAAANAWRALTLAMKTNPIGIILGLVTSLATAIFLFKDNTEDSIEQTKTFTDTLSEERTKFDLLFNSLQKAKKGSYEYKDALFQINSMYGKYLPNLITEKTSISEIADARKIANKGLLDEIFLKERNVQLSDAIAKKDKAIAEIMDDIQKNNKLSPTTQRTTLNRILDIASNEDALNPEKRKALISKLFKGDLDAIDKYVQKATIAISVYNATMANIDAFFTPATIIDNKIPSDLLKNAKDEFEAYSKLTTDITKKEFIDKATFMKKDTDTYKAYLDEQWIKYKSNYESRVLIENELADIEKNKSKGSKNSPEDKATKTKLKLQEEANEQSLAEFKRNEQLTLAEQAKASNELIENDDALKAALEEQKYESDQRIIAEEIRLQEELLKLTKEGSTERASIESKIAKFKEDAAQTSTDRTVDLINDEIAARKKALSQQKKDANDASKQLLSDTENNIIKEQTILTKKAGEDIKAAKGNAKKTKEIRYNLAQDMLNIELMYRKDVNTNDTLMGDDKQRNSDRIFDVEKNNEEQKLKKTEDTESAILDVKKQIFEKSAELVNAGFDLIKQSYANQLSVAQETYNSEIDAAGDNLTERIIAERKFEKEKKRIARNQAIAEKAQAAFSIALSTAQAIIAVWANPLTLVGAPVLTALIASLGAAQLATVLAQPIPAYFKGVENAPETFIAGDTPDGKGATELIHTKSGLDVLTPAKATLFSDPMFKGAKIFPHDKTQEMLNSYAINGGSQVFVDMSGSEKYLNQIAKNTKNTEISGIDAKGRQFIKRGGTVTTY